MAYGNRALARPHGLTADSIESLRSIPVAELSDAMFGAGTLSSSIHPLSLASGEKIIGTAITVNVPTASVKMALLAISQVQPGDVFVLNGHANALVTFAGGNMMRTLKRRGAVGAIVDGAIRDLDEILEEEFPVFALGTRITAGPVGPDVGEVNTPIACGGVVINPGDIVVADTQGIVSIPRDHLAQVLERVSMVAEKEKEMAAPSFSGEIYGYEPVLKLLTEAGCKIAPEFYGHTPAGPPDEPESSSTSTSTKK